MDVDCQKTTLDVSLILSCITSVYLCVFITPCSGPQLEESTSFMVGESDSSVRRRGRMSPILSCVIKTKFIVTDYIRKFYVQTIQKTTTKVI